jgi:hypothetical protein
MRVASVLLVLWCLALPPSADGLFQPINNYQPGILGQQFSKELCSAPIEIREASVHMAAGPLLPSDGGARVWGAPSIFNIYFPADCDNNDCEPFLRLDGSYAIT